MTGFMRKSSENVRSLVQTGVLGVAAGLASVAFLYCTNFLFARTYLVFATRPRPYFLVASFLVIIGFSVLVSLLLRYVATSTSEEGEVRPSFLDEPAPLPALPDPTTNP